jgi:predicted  nucleic acid-binding Zn-ribbon protein
LNAGIQELEKSLSVEQRRLGDYQRDLERMEEKKPIVKQNIQDTEGKIKDIEASIFVLKKMVEE